LLVEKKGEEKRFRKKRQTYDPAREGTPGLGKNLLKNHLLNWRTLKRLGGEKERKWGQCQEEGAGRLRPVLNNKREGGGLKKTTLTKPQGGGQPPKAVGELASGDSGSKKFCLGKRTNRVKCLSS